MPAMASGTHVFGQIERGTSSTDRTAGETGAYPGHKPSPSTTHARSLSNDLEGQLWPKGHRRTPSGLTRYRESCRRFLSRPSNVFLTVASVFLVWATFLMLTSMARGRMTGLDTAMYSVPHERPEAVDDPHHVPQYEELKTAGVLPAELVEMDRLRTAGGEPTSVRTAKAVPWYERLRPSRVLSQDLVDFDVLRTMRANL